MDEQLVDCASEHRAILPARTTGLWLPYAASGCQREILLHIGCDGRASSAGLPQSRQMMPKRTGLAMSFGRLCAVMSHSAACRLG